MNDQISKVRLRFITMAVGLLIAIVALSVFWNRSIKEELAFQATNL